MSAACNARALGRYLGTQIGPFDRISQTHTAWHSATFAGERHRFVCSVPATVDLAAFARDLPEADIPLPRGFVADAQVASVDPVAHDQCVTLEFLTVDPD